MYVYIYICIYICIYIWTLWECSVCILTCRHVHLHMYTHVYTHLYMQNSFHVHGYFFQEYVGIPAVRSVITVSLLLTTSQRVLGGSFTFLALGGLACN